MPKRKPGASQPYMLKPGEGWTYSFGPNFVIKAGEIGAGRRLAFVEYTTRAGEEPGDHTHATEDEIFYVLDGEVTFRCGDKTFDAENGAFVFLPRGLQHGYTIKSSEAVRMLVITSPADERAMGGWGGFIGDLERGDH
jgi:quercetin dioxygenase-like cupin family protein